MVDAAPILRMVSLTKQFGRLVAVNDVTLDIQEGEFFTIVGPSGSGKTTLLRMLGGLEKPTAGDIYLRDERVNQVPANRRPTCMVFQSLALFNHKTVGQNIEFSLKMRGESRRARRERGLSLMNVVQLPEDYYDKSVTKCSGGERQRVALARALASDPTSCSSTSRCPPSTIGCASCWRSSSRTSTAPRARPSSTSPTASKRRW